MITVRAVIGAIGVCLLLALAGCSREQQDWRAAEAADTIDGYGQFIQRHPESELATQARSRITQLGEERDWQHAGSADTVEAYREFIAQHPNGKWAEEARIRVENFSLAEQAGRDTAKEGSPAPTASTTPRSPQLAAPGEAASPAPVADAAAPQAVAAADPSTSKPAAADASASKAGAATPAPKLGAATLTPIPGAAAPASKPGAAALAATPNASTIVRTPSTPTIAPAHGVSTQSTVEASASPGFGIQLGAFSSEANADNEWRLITARFPADLRGLQPHLVPAGVASKRIYRLQAAVGNEGRARAICDSLRQHGQACVAVLPN